MEVVKGWEMGGATSVALGFAWFSEKHWGVLIAMSEGSFSVALIWDPLPAGVVVVVVGAAVVEGVDVCALLLLFGFLSLSV